jgi:peptidoglycan/LPS O-acetylase OafA/YrhL
MKQRYSELDAIRGIAALMVVLFHYTVRYGQIYEYSINPIFSFELGKYGVQLFFIVSGFVIFLTLDKTVNAIDFVVSRFSRLYPAYWVSVILTFVIVYTFSLPGREVDLQSALVNLTMIQKWLEVDNVDGVYWTLAIELSFYLIMYILFITKQLKNIFNVTIVWLLMIIVVRFLETNNIIQIHWALKLLFLLDYGELFIAGIMFYKIMHNDNLSNYIILLLVLGTEYYLHGKLAYLIAGYFFLFLLFAKGYLHILSLKPLVYLGTISYSLYLIHQNIGYIIIRNLENYGLINPISIIIIPLVISIGVATIMQIYIEKPTLLFIRNRWKQSKFRSYLKKDF